MSSFDSSGRRPRRVILATNSEEITFALQEGRQPIFPLSAENAHHLLKVARLKRGAPITVLCGEATFDAIVSSLSPAQVQIVRMRTEGRFRFRTETAIVGAIRGSRMDWLCEKATELGIRELCIVQTRRSEPQALDETKLTRLVRVVAAATEQSNRDEVPQVKAYSSVAECLSTLETEGKARILLSLRPQAPPIRELVVGVQEPVIVAAGPEGDFTDDEIECFEQHGFQHATLGASILRVETAVIAGIAAANAVWGART